MTRLTWSIWRDFRIQLRSGYPWPIAAATILCIAAFARIPGGDNDILAPFASLAFSCLTTLPFLIFQVLAEKREGSLALLDLTPLRPHEYLASKAISLALPSIACNTALVLIARGPYFNPGFFWTGLAVSGTLFAWFGFLALSLGLRGGKTAAIASGAALLLLVPVFPNIGLISKPWFPALPLGGPAILIRASYESISIFKIVYAAVSCAVWMGVALIACRKGFARLRIP